MDPFKELEEVSRRMQNMFGGTSLGGYRETEDYQRPNVDVMNKEKEITIIAELPGMEKEDIDLKVEPNHVEVTAETSRGKETEQEGYYYKERSSKSFKRVLPLPEEVKPDTAKATYKNGVLEVTIQKVTPGKEKGRRVPIN